MRNRVLLALAFGALAIAAVAGWARKPGAGAAGLLPAAYDGTAGLSHAMATEPVQPCLDTASYAAQLPEFADSRAVRVVKPRPAAAQPETAAPERGATRGEARKKGRSTAKSAAIVAGSAGVGAAIGGIAGGGKGAAIGALSGGAAGFIYDRITHNR